VLATATSGQHTSGMTEL